MKHDIMKKKENTMRYISTSFLLIGAVLLLTGFNLDKSLVPREDILSGGPPKDGIPALINPTIAEGKKASYLNPSDRVIGLVVNGEARAYPIKILNWHEAVNDELGGEPILVTF